MIELILGLGVIFFLIWKWWNQCFSYWKDKGFPYVPASWPLGTQTSLILFSRYQGEEIKEVYDKYKSKRYVGLIIGRRPNLLLCDPEVIKNVMLKDFNHFTDRMQADLVNKQSAISRHLFNLGGEQWKLLRTKISPTFTSGKLKLMFSLFQRCAKQLEDVVIRKKDNEVDVKEIMSRFTCDVISSCAFGIDTNCLVSDDSAVYNMALRIFPAKVDLRRRMFTLLLNIFPNMDKVYRPNLVPKDLEEFMAKLVKDTVAHRESTTVKRNDFFDLMLELRNSGAINSDKTTSKGIEITDEDITAQVFVFLAAGFETSSSVSTYCLYELACNPDIQDKLREEIHAAKDKEGSLTYQAIMDMPYLDQVISETMRKYPTIPVLTRKCTMPYRMPDKPDLVVEKNTRIIIPIYALHRDPQYFPDPEKFDPERFSPENKSSITPYTYIPFGEGPRLCIGMRFGLLQTKMGVATIVDNFILKKSDKTPEELRFVASGLITITEKPVYLNVEKLS